MRIYRDLEMMEQLGSRLPRILQTYGQECFKFSDNYIRMSFPAEIGEEEKGTEKLNGGLNSGVNDLFNLISDNPGINTNALMKQMNTPRRTIERWLKQLREENKIEFKGAAKTGGYFATNSEKE